jgi:hypothetical protein
MLVDIFVRFDGLGIRGLEEIVYCNICENNAAYARMTISALTLALVLKRGIGIEIMEAIDGLA